MHVQNRVSQNFLNSPALVSKLISSKTDIHKDDTVLDIGAGKGIISKELLRHAKRVIAYEIDLKYASSLKNFAQAKNLEVHLENFLKADINKLGSDVKVFSNIPFFLTADITRKLFIENSNVESAYLIMEKEAAWRFLGKPYKKNSVLSVLIGMRYESKILWNFNNNDFFPRPNANIVLVGFKKREKFIYHDYFIAPDFVSYVFNIRKKSIKNALYDFWPYEKVKSLLKNLRIGTNESVAEVDAIKWIDLLKEFKKIDKEKQEVVRGEYAKLLRHQQKLNKNKIIVYNS